MLREIRPYSDYHDLFLFLIFLYPAFLSALCTAEEKRVQQAEKEVFGRGVI